MIGIFKFYVGTLDSLKHSLCMSQGCRSLPQLLREKINSNCIRPWLECWHWHSNIRIKEPATKPTKTLRKVSKVGEKILDLAGFEPIITAPLAQALIRSATLLAAAGYQFLAKFIHLASIILTARQLSITEIQAPWARQQPITEIQTPHQQPIAETQPP